MESYVERWKREQLKLHSASLYGGSVAEPQKETRKKSGTRRKPQKETQVGEETRGKEETQDGKDSRSEGHETP